MTECNGIATSNPADVYALKPTSCGKPLLHMEVRIADDALNELPTGQVGEVLLRSSALMKGAGLLHT